MGARGPTKQPTQIRILRGNPSKEPLPENEFKPKPILSSCPDWINEEAKKVWHDLSPKLQDLVTEIDHYNFMNLCLSISEMKLAQMIVDKEGLTYVLTTKNGDDMVYQRPEVAIVKRNMELIAKIGAKFGMSPSDRVGLVSGNNEKKESAMDRLISK